MINYKINILFSFFQENNVIIPIIYEYIIQVILLVSACQVLSFSEAFSFLPSFLCLKQTITNILSTQYNNRLSNQFLSANEQSQSITLHPLLHCKHFDKSPQQTLQLSTKKQPYPYCAALPNNIHAIFSFLTLKQICCTFLLYLYRDWTAFGSQLRCSLKNIIKKTILNMVPFTHPNQGK